MARFFHELLVAGTVLAPTELARMRDFRPLDVGWAKGYIQYVSAFCRSALLVLKYCIATLWSVVVVVLLDCTVQVFGKIMC